MTEDRANYVPTADGYAWAPPDEVPEAVKAEAGRLIAPLFAALEPASPRLVGDWLARLGVLVAGNLSAADARIKIAAYAADLRYPALCFTDQTRADAAKAFKFFPSFAELSEFLDGIAAPHRTKLHRIRAIAGRPVRQEPRGRGWGDLSPAERLAHDAMMASLRRELESADSAASKPLYPAV